MAVLLVADPRELLMVTWKLAPLSAVVVAGVVYVAEVAPLIALPFFDHWYVSGDWPAALTENVAICPALTL